VENRTNRDAKRKITNVILPWVIEFQSQKLVRISRGKAMTVASILYNQPSIPISRNATTHCVTYANSCVRYQRHRAEQGRVHTSASASAMKLADRILSCERGSCRKLSRKERNTMDDISPNNR
jgi:hypothetical protein